jgi:hypothetical protein
VTIAVITDQLVGREPDKELSYASNLSIAVIADQVNGSEPERLFDPA